MNSTIQTLATPLSPLLTHITNNAPSAPYRPSGELTPEQQARLQASVDTATTTLYVWSAISVVSAFASAYHGAARNKGSVGWGLAWGAAGACFPIVTPAIAIAQGFAQPAGK